MSYVSKLLPVMLTVLGATAQAQATPYTATVAEDPNGNYVKTNVVVVPELVESRFGDKNTYVLGGGSSANIGGTHTELKGVKTDALGLGFNVMAGQFVAHNVLLGVEGGVDANVQDDFKILSTQVGPVAGYNVRIHEHSSFLPTLAVLYDYKQSWNPDQVGNHSHAVNIELALQFSLNVTRHLNVLVGPYASQSVYNHEFASGGADEVRNTNRDLPWTTNYGLRASLLGWM